MLRPPPSSTLFPSTTLFRSLAAALSPVFAAPPPPSTKAPHPSAPVVRAAGMTLEIRSDRVVVTEVAKGSPADRAGVRPLDVLLSVNGRSLVDLDPISPQQVLALLQYEQTLRTRILLGRGPARSPSTCRRTRLRSGPRRSRRRNCTR